jgi:hypothetical protein
MRPTLFVVTACAMAAASPLAAQTPNDQVAVVVERAADTLTVRIAGRMDLRQVLLAVCERAAARCQIATKAGKVMLAGPAVVEGSWLEVVAGLMQGTGLGYAVLPAGAEPARLLVEAPATVATPARTEPSREKIDEVEPPAQEGPVVAGETAEPTIPPAPETAPPEPSGPKPAEPLKLPAAGAAVAEQPETVATPFATPDGKPLIAVIPPGPKPTVNILPFSDERGDPITVPITNEPVILTPFVGPDGQTVVVSPGMPGVKLSHPNQPPPRDPKTDQR